MFFTPTETDACVEEYSQLVVVNPYPEFDVWLSDSVIYSNSTVDIIVSGVNQVFGRHQIDCHVITV